MCLNVQKLVCLEPEVVSLACHWLECVTGGEWEEGRGGLECYAVTRPPLVNGPPPPATNGLIPLHSTAHTHGEANHPAGEMALAALTVEQHCPAVLVMERSVLYAWCHLRKFIYYFLSMKNNCLRIIFEIYY